MKKIIKILPILMTVIMVLTIVTPVFADTIGGIDINPSTDEVGSKVGNVGNSILGIIKVVGTLIAVGVLMVLGIKYMMGSAEEKAEYKKTMIPYLIGAVLLFAAVQLAGWVVDIAGTITNT